MNPVQLETFKRDLGGEMDGPKVTEKDSGLTLSFSSHIVSTQVSHCQDKWHSVLALSTFPSLHL